MKLSEVKPLKTVFNITGDRYSGYVKIKNEHHDLYGVCCVVLNLATMQVKTEQGNTVVTRIYDIKGLKTY